MGEEILTENFFGETKIKPSCMVIIKMNSYQNPGILQSQRDLEHQKSRKQRIINTTHQKRGVQERIRQYSDGFWAHLTDERRKIKKKRICDKRNREGKKGRRATSWKNKQNECLTSGNTILFKQNIIKTPFHQTLHTS